METTINAGDTAWVMISIALVTLMTPALGFSMAEWSGVKIFWAFCSLNYVVFTKNGQNYSFIWALCMI